MESDPYRSRWRANVQRHASRNLHQGAIAKTLAQYLWDSGEVSDVEVDLPRRLKDTVSRALGGRTLAASTLTQFIGAFRFSPTEAAELWALRMGRDPGRLSVIRDDLALEAPVATARPAYQTIALHEFHTVGADRLPSTHRTVHVIRALEQVSSYRYRFDTSAAAVEVLRGGTVGPLVRDESQGLYGVDIHFHRPLAAGETGSFEYQTIFSYKTPPPMEFRRGALRRVDNVELHVQFHPDCLPVKVWWGVWTDHHADAPDEQEAVELDPDGSVHRYLDALEGRTVGFHWRFTAQRGHVR